MPSMACPMGITSPAVPPNAVLGPLVLQATFPQAAWVFVNVICAVQIAISHADWVILTWVCVPQAVLQMVISQAEQHPGTLSEQLLWELKMQMPRVESGPPYGSRTIPGMPMGHPAAMPPASYGCLPMPMVRPVPVSDTCGKGMEMGMGTPGGVTGHAQKHPHRTRDPDYGVLRRL